MRYAVIIATIALTVDHLTMAQTYTDCNPTEKSNCPVENALGRKITVDFTKGESDQFTLAQGTTLTYDNNNGAAFSISDETQAPTIESAWYIFFGKIDITMQAAPGQGIVSSFVLESETLDEIDWEWLGGDTTHVQSNYFGKGNTTTYDRGQFHADTAPQTNFKTYSIDWTKDYVKWSIDGTVVRTLLYADALGGKNFPQTPCRVKMGNWVGGSSTAAKGTVEWAGGLSDFSKDADLPYSMYVKSITIEDGTTSGSTYTYGDMTGSYESIKIGGSSGGSGATNATGPIAGGSSSVSFANESGTTSIIRSTKGGILGSAPTATTTTGETVSTTSAPSSSSTSISSGSSSSSSSSSSYSSSSTSIYSSSSTSSYPSSSTSSYPSSSTTSNRVNGTSSTLTAPSAISTGGGSKYGIIDIGVGILGIALGYLVM